MITSNGPADVKLQQDTVKPWEDKTGNKVEVIAASDMNQQLTQGFAAGSPPDLFFTDATSFPTYAKAGNLVAYGDQLPMKSDFYEGLVKTFTYDGKFYCAPKDFSTLALIINTDLWQKAGLGTGDMPKNWSDLETVAQKLTTDKVKGLVIGDTRDRVGAFMKQAGGWIVSPDQTRMTADTATNLAGLTEVQKLLASGSASYPKGVDAGWGGEALGQGKAAMTIEGNWIKGAIKNDYPNLKWQAVELPAGPAAKGTLSFTQCYGVASASKNQAAADRPRQVPLDPGARDGARHGARRHAVAQVGRGRLQGRLPQRRGLHRRGRVRAGPGDRRRHGPGAQGLRHPAAEPARR